MPEIYIDRYDVDVIDAMRPALTTLLERVRISSPAIGTTTLRSGRLPIHTHCGGVSEPRAAKIEVFRSARTFSH